MVLSKTLARGVRGLALAVTLLGTAAAQQANSDTPLKVGNVVFSGSIRERVEGWDWFSVPHASNPYGYSETLIRFGLSESTQYVDWRVEFAAPVLIGNPDHAVFGAPQGQLGFGGTYFASNHNDTNTAFVFPKQAYLQFHAADGRGQGLQVGRFEFNEGLELLPQDKTLAALERDRIAQRLIGVFGFSVTGRSSDGGRYSVGAKNTNFTAAVFRPTRGAFQVDGWGEVNIAVGYAALTHTMGGPRASSEARVFVIEYDDFRGGVLKTDNRTAAARSSDRNDIDIQTYGANYTGTARAAGNSFDLLLWGVLQRGNWGVLRQKSDAYALEGGWQPPVPYVRPWLRGGLDYGSGDHNSRDNVHGTFFQILPTGRQYARFPFFNEMNLRDEFGELILRPAKALTLRADVHGLALANKNDLWYSGSGAYQPWTFGFQGRTSNGHSSFANLYDISADYQLSKHTTTTLYFAHAEGKAVMASIYPTGRNANMGYLEMLYRF